MKFEATPTFKVGFGSKIFQNLSTAINTSTLKVSRVLGFDWQAWAETNSTAHQMSCVNHQVAQVFTKVPMPKVSKEVS